jgi:hypothetical protein
MNHVNDRNLKLTKKDIYKNKDYDWAIKQSKKLKRIFIKFCKKHNLKSQKHYKIDWLHISIKLGQCPDHCRRWNIDHIVPICKFDLQFDEEVIKCWNFDNLCYLPKIVNNEKSDKINWTISDITKNTMSKLTKQEKEYLKEINKRYEQKKETNSYE